MKKIATIISRGAIVAAMAAMTLPTNVTAAEVNGWGDFKLFIDPGHSGRENQGMWGYSEAQKTLRVALAIQEYLTTYTDVDSTNIKLCRYTDSETVSLEERSDMANAWGADFYYSIHSDAGATQNTIVTLFGGWRKNGVEIEKTPNGGKAYGEFLEPNLKGVMRVGSRGNWHDRCFYDRTPETHTNQYPYLSVNRRSTMPSLLSEGGYHTIAEQQQRNINDDYKRLEALAAFHSLLQYRGLERPVTTTLTGVIRNSENQQPINGAKVTVGDRTYTTDTWESTFKSYTNNPDLIHNGFYYFEGLTAGDTVEVKFECEGFDPITTKATIKSGGETTADYVTYLDVEMTNIAPAKIDAISLDDLDAVSPIYPLTITFSRNMDRKSVEDAFSINNDGDVSLTWENDYTLVVDLSKLEPLWDYTITISGDVAKNSLTNQKLDGDGDGTEGGDYTLTFTMAEPDFEAPYIVNTYPAIDGEAVFTHRPVIGVEFNEELNWNDDKNADCLTVTDAAGKTYSGTLTHAVIRGRSVIQYYLDEDLPADKAFLVTISSGLTDLSGNVADEMYFRFLSEYRTQTSYTTLWDCNTTGSWWAPGGSGSTKGIIIDDSKLESSTLSYKKGDPGSMKMTYVFDMGAANPVWNIREYWKGGLDLPINDMNSVVTAWVYGDASNNTIGIRLRCNSKSGGLKYRDPEMTIDFRGWRLLHWDLKNDSWATFTGNDALGVPAYFDSFFMIHEDIDPDDEELTYQEWDGEINFDELGYGLWDSVNCTRTAKITDIVIPSSGVENVTGAESNVNVTYDGVSVIVNAQSSAMIEVFNTAGQKVAYGNGPVLCVAQLPQGVYAAKVTTASGNSVLKFIR